MNRDGASRQALNALALACMNRDGASRQALNALALDLAFASGFREHAAPALPIPAQAYSPARCTACQHRRLVCPAYPLQ